MILAPYWLIAIGRKIGKFSNWVDEKLFPVPATLEQLKSAEQRNIEQSALLVWRMIYKSNTLVELYACQDAIRDFRLIWGESTQVKSHCDSMNVEVYLRMKKAPALQ